MPYSSATAAYLWARDPEVEEMIKYFDQPGKKDNLKGLNSKELEWIAGQALKCQEDFIWAARNYFKITTKRGEDKLFALWESQELVLDRIYYLKARYKRVVRLFILKARQLGASTLIEAMIAWRTMFWPNTNALVVSNVAHHAAYLFGIMLHIYDQVPWWLKPMIASRKQEDGLLFHNPDPDLRRDFPGLNSLITVQEATQLSGIGQGIRLSCIHGSEITDWLPSTAREAIDGDMGKALAEEDPNNFGILETTGRGAGQYCHKLWRKNVELAENAMWTPLFLPAFMEKSRVLPPPSGWHVQGPELDMRARVKDAWVRCDNPVCGQWHESFVNNERWTFADCPWCSTGVMQPFEMSNQQLYYMFIQRLNAQTDVEAQKTMAQELAITAEDAWQLSGYQMFGYNEQKFAADCVRNPIATGNIDAKGAFHGVKEIQKDAGGNVVRVTCWQDWCEVDHRYDDTPLKIWEWPQRGYQYTVGCDVAEGLGADADYSVAVVNKIGRGFEPDVQVATYRSNTITPIEFAWPCCTLGHMYNEAMMSIEVNKYDTTFTTARFQYQYPHMFRWKHLDSTNPLSNKWGWITQENTRPRLWQTARQRLRSKLWIVRSENLAEELKTFQKEEYDSRGGGASEGFHDDEAMAAFIALYTSHDMDWSDTLQCVPLPGQQAVQQDPPWTMKCSRCGHEWPSEFCEIDYAASPTGPQDNPGCPKCRCMLVSGRQKDVNMGHSATPPWATRPGVKPSNGDTPGGDSSDEAFDDFAEQVAVNFDLL